MLVFKFEKVKSARFISHLDVLTAITRTIRRADIDMKYSEGYNPHMLINLSNPIPLGIESVAEYCCVNCEMKKNQFKKVYVENQLKDLGLIECYSVSKNPNLAGYSHSSVYEITSPYMDTQKAVKYLTDERVIIEYQGKKGQEVKDVKALIYGIEELTSGVRLQLAFGNTNLRADRIAYNILNNQDCLTEGLEIKKTASYVQIEGRIIEVDKYLSNI